MSTTPSLNRGSATHQAEVGQSVSSSGIIAGTVLRAARLSGGLTQAELGAAVSAGKTTIAAWEDGGESLAEVPYAVSEQLEAALTAAGADHRLVADLAIAAWCDIVLTALGDSQDVRCLLADPIAAGEEFSELLAWSTGGERPERYCPYVDPGPPLGPTALGVITGAMRKVNGPW